MLKDNTPRARGQLMMRHRGLLAIAFCLIVTLYAVQVATPATSSTIHLRANLTAGQQVPAQAVKAANATAQFSGTLVPQGPTGKLKKPFVMLNWQLAYSGLSSQPTLAYVLVPASGKQGQVIVQLCKGKQCAVDSKASGQSILPQSVVQALSGRTAYVGIQTQKNPHGEIRGKLLRA
jgi:hypothetical protein